MAILLANNANGNLSGAITAAATTITLQTGQGAMFPIPNTVTGDFFPVTLVRPTGELEICYCTKREGDVLTVTRARESTTAKTFSAGDRVSLRLTTGVMQTIFDVVNNITPFAKTLLDDANASTARATLGAQASDATLTALAGVTTAANKLIYATAPDVFTTTSITPFARTLIDDVDAAAMRTTLGIDELPVRSFIGDTPPINPWNGVTWYCTDDGRTYVYYADADSTQWVENSPQNPANTDTLSGTNVNGNYAQFADGTLICWVSTTTSAAATKAITYPMAFISAPVCTATVEATTPSIVTTQSPSVTGISINGWNMSSARIAVACKIMAVGRWR